MILFSSSRGRLAWGPLFVLTLWATTRGVSSAQKTAFNSPHFAATVSEVRRHDGFEELPIVSLGTSGSLGILSPEDTKEQHIGKN